MLDTSPVWPQCRDAGTYLGEDLFGGPARLALCQGSLVLVRHQERRAGYEPWKAYAQSKAANILLAVALDSIGRSKGVRAFAVHPGGIFDTGLLRHVDKALAQDAGMIDAETSCVVVQNPSVFGQIKDLKPLAAKAQAAGALLIVVVTEIVSLGAVSSCTPRPRPGRAVPTMAGRLA